MKDIEVAILKNEKNCSIKRRKESDITNGKINDLNKKYGITNQVIKTMQEDIKEIKDVMKEFIKSADSKYAKKETTDFITKVLWTFGIAIILGMGGFIWDLLTSNVIGK